MANRQQQSISAQRSQGSSSHDYRPPSLQNFDLETFIRERGGAAGGASSLSGDPDRSERSSVGDDTLVNPSRADLLDLAADSFFRTEYKHRDVEDWYVLFSQRNKYPFAFTSLLAGLVWLASFLAPMMAYRPMSFVMTALNFGLLAIHQYYQYRLGGKSNANHDNHVRLCKIQETLGAILMGSGVYVALDVYSRSERCYQSTTGRFAMFDEGTKAHICGQLWAYPLLYMMMPIVFIDVRKKYTLPINIAIALFTFAGYAMATEYQEPVRIFLAKAFAIGTLTWGMTVGVSRLEESSRARFVAWVNTQRRTVSIKSQRNSLDLALQYVLPAASLRLLLRNQPVINTSNKCSIGVCQIFDFAKWSCSLLPRLVVETIDTFFTILDKVIADFDADKVKTVGDRYITALGLLCAQTPRTGNGQPPVPVHDPTMLIRLGLFCLNVANRIQSALGEGFTFDLQVGIHTGQCMGAIVGGFSLWYEVFGEGFDVATRLVRQCPKNSVLISQATLDLVGANFICIESEVEDRERTEFGGRTYQVMAEMCEDGDEPSAPFASGNGEGAAECDKESKDRIDSDSINTARRALLLSRVLKLHKKERLPLPGVRKLTHIGDSLQFWDGLNFDNKRLSRIDHDLDIRHGPWYALIFADDHAERKYRQFQRFVTEEPTGLHAATLCFICLDVAIFGTALIEDTHTWSSSLLLLANCLMLGLRLIHRRHFHPPKAELAVGVLVVSNLYGASFLLQRGVINAGFSWIFAICATIGCWFFLSLQWEVVAAGTLLCAAGSLLCDYLYRGFFFAPDAGPTIAFALAIVLAAYMNELKIREQFRDIAKCKVLEETSEREYVMTTTLLDMILPRYVVGAVVEKCIAGRKAIVHSLGDVCVGAIRFDTFTSEVSKRFAHPKALLNFVENHFSCIEEAIESSKRYVSKVHTLGDTLLLAGPLRETDSVSKLPSSRTADVETSPRTEADSDHSNAMVDCHVAAPPEDVLLEAAKHLLSILWDLRVRWEIPMTAIVAYGSGFAAVTGIRRPAFDVLGTVTRTAFELLEEAPAKLNFIGMQDNFCKLLVDGRVRLPRSPEDFEVGERLRWRLRGCGVVYVRPLHDPVYYPPKSKSTLTWESSSTSSDRGNSLNSRYSRRLRRE